MLLKGGISINIIENPGICSLGGVEENFVGYMCCLAEENEEALVFSGKKDTNHEGINKLKSFKGKVLIIQDLISPVDKALSDLITGKSSTCTVLADPRSCHLLIGLTNCTRVKVIYCEDTCVKVKPLKSVVIYEN